MVFLQWAANASALHLCHAFLPYAMPTQGTLRALVMMHLWLEVILTATCEDEVPKDTFARSLGPSVRYI